jgi:hypothetical protein
MFAFVRLVVDAVVFDLVMAFDTASELIEQTALEPVAWNYESLRGTLSDQLLWKYRVPLTLISTVERCV